MVFEVDKRMHTVTECREALTFLLCISCFGIITGKSLVQTDKGVTKRKQMPAMNFVLRRERERERRERVEKERGERVEKERRERVEKETDTSKSLISK